MYLKKTPNTHGRIRLSIVDNYYDKVKKCSRQKTVESVGWLDELEKQYDDPIAYFTKRVAQLNDEKKKKQAPINFTFYDSDRLCIGDNLRKNFGYAALSQIYHELGIHTFLINRQRHSKEQYDSNTIMKMLVYSRLLFPASKKSSYDSRERFFENTEYSLDDVYRCLSFLDKHRENLQIWMKNRSKYPAAMGGVLILAAIAAQLKGLPRFFILFYAFLASIYSHMIRTVSSMPSLLLLIENS